jgi:hypothetical protein
MPIDFEVMPCLALIAIILLSTFVPFITSWLLKMHCNKRELAFRFISRKWIITVIPCATVVYLVTLHESHMETKLIAYIIIWASCVSGLFLLGEHISQALSKLYSIKYKDVSISFDAGTDHIKISEKDKCDGKH